MMAVVSERCMSIPVKVFGQDYVTSFALFVV
jgi:hypothetical protein